MKRIFLAVLIALISLQVLHALPKSDVKYGPWITNVSETEATIFWTTESRYLGWIEMIEDDGSTYYKAPKKAFYQTVAGRRTFSTFHRVTLTGLKPGTKYMYRIVMKKVNEDSHPYNIKYDYLCADKVRTFRTLDSSADSCRFSMVNDIHQNDERYIALLKDVNAENTDFLMLCGDIVNDSRSFDKILSHLIVPVTDKTSSMPVFSARGNHETRGFAFEDFLKFFPGPKGQLYYTFRQGPVAFVVLDAGEDKPDSDFEYFGTAEFDPYRQKEAEWLKEAVEEPSFAKAPVKICVIHIPAYTDKEAWYAQREATRLFGPILKKAGVDLMLSGHLHEHLFIEKGEKGNPYPILVNSNTERLEVKATRKGIRLDCYDAGSVLVHSYEVKK